mgnify:CR=1 FL=1
MTEADEAPNAEQGVVSAQTVEQLVRHRLAEAFGGIRGVIETAVPTLVFTVWYLSTGELKQGLIVAAGITVVLLVIRLLQRSELQFVINALFGIGLAALFASRSGEARDVFLPGILYNSAYAVVLTLTILIGWPLMGFLVGGMVGDLTEWRKDPGMRKLCSRLTWFLVIPCIVRVAVQYPLWVADEIALLATTKIILGWPLQIASLVGMGWLLARNATPLDAGDSR